MADECVGAALRQSWDPATVALGFSASVLGAYVGLTTMTYARTISRVEFPRWYAAFIFSSGLSIGGGCVWIMHFIG